MFLLMNEHELGHMLVMSVVQIHQAFELLPGQGTYKN